MRHVRVNVGIVGAGPAGLALANVLRQHGISTIVVEKDSRETVETTPRAGLIEQRTVTFLERAELATGLLTNAMRTGSCTFIHQGEAFSVPYADLAEGRKHYIYPQQFLVRDLIAIHGGAGGDILFSHEVTQIDGGDATEPATMVARSTKGAESVEIRCDFIAAADGSDSIAHRAVPESIRMPLRHQHPFRWLALLADVPPFVPEIVYGMHPIHGAAQMPRTATVSRFYLQIQAGETVNDWNDDRIWAALRDVLVVKGHPVTTGTITEKAIIGRSDHVSRTMQHGRIFLLGDAAHTISLAGGKGMNLAVADAEVLGAAMARYYDRDDEQPLENYTRERQPKIWKAVLFSHWLINLLHSTAGDAAASAFSNELRLATIRELRSQGPVARMFAEEYAGE
ncbi:4-hydroxybenzoate 3-monooxygenase [Paractinoplanes brasiliensis]|uniref:p-hydroxybenzoate 3-monooxygenase n=1 Tax=Paractinoplanes brasiliensis TaxID=52695 RepID=A0A4R6JP15_9ACTN|nr:4-hydroxybenzoate 3-monooxygenase [Actinoplanes brasiliensis]TDO37121.1 p-hydroxybenzoate 3-monooxygenase [Actinoplanes brasiliensis]GID32183.1 4-hydroxybenzoate 3-monooxygenase [Actinoplanes brasiliensis]